MAGSTMSYPSCPASAVAATRRSVVGDEWGAEGVRAGAERARRPPAHNDSTHTTHAYSTHIAHSSGRPVPPRSHMTAAAAIAAASAATRSPPAVTPSEPPSSRSHRTPHRATCSPSPAAHAASQRVSLMARALAHPSKPLATSTPVAAAPAAPPTATRLLLLEDGSAFGSWSDSCSLLLHPGARTLTMLLPDGSTLRSLSSLVPSAARPKMATLLAFRNMLATGEHEAPVLDRDSWQGGTFTSTTTYPFARWGLHRPKGAPLSPLPFDSAQLHHHHTSTSGETDEGRVHTAAEAEGEGGMAGPILAQAGAHSAGLSPSVSHESDGSVRVDSMDPRVSLTLLPNAHWVRLRYPVPLQRTVKRVDPLTGAMEYEYLYADFAQLLPVAAVPPRWKYPLQCALRASHVHQIEREERRLARIEQQQQQERGQRGGVSTDESFSSSSDASFLQHSLLLSTETNDSNDQLLPDLAMDLPQVRALRPGGAANGVSAAGLDWPDVPGHSVPLLHSLPDALPKDSLVTCLWTPDALYWTFIAPTLSNAPGVTATATPETPSHQVSVCVLVHVDQSCLVLQPNGFFHHFLEPSLAVDPDNEGHTHGPPPTASMFASLSRSMQREQQHQRDQLATGGNGSLRKRVYAVGGVPRLSNPSGLNPGEAQYELGRIAARAVRMRDHALGVLDGRHTEAREAARKIGALAALASSHPGGPNGLSLSPTEMAGLAVSAQHVAASAKHEVLFSAAVHERCMQRGLGEFTAFKDGRVKVRFIDRCLLELRSSRIEANLLLPNGFPLQLTLPLEAGMDQYAHREQLQREWVQFEVERSKRALALRRIARGESPYAEGEFHTVSANSTGSTSVSDLAASYARMELHASTSSNSNSSSSSGDTSAITSVPCTPASSAHSYRTPMHATNLQAEGCGSHTSVVPGLRLHSPLACTPSPGASFSRSTAPCSPNELEGCGGGVGGGSPSSSSGSASSRSSTRSPDPSSSMLSHASLVHAVDAPATGVVYPYSSLRAPPPPAASVSFLSPICATPGAVSDSRAHAYHAHHLSLQDAATPSFAHCSPETPAHPHSPGLAAHVPMHVPAPVADQSVSLSDVSYWLADLQHRNQRMQQQLLHTSRHLETFIPAV